MGFNWQAYLDNYPDLRMAGISTQSDAIKHWNNNGKKEKRTDKPLNNIYDNMCLIDWQDYLNNYPDLQKAGITTYEDACTHWVNYGISEDRVINPLYSLELPVVRNTNTIPKVIYQTWHTKNLPPDMAGAVEQLKLANPGYKHELYDDDDCRELIKQNFPPQVLYAYDALTPGAFKADLWRYCVLYLRGGIYMDIKFVPVDWFSFDSIISEEQFCYDDPDSQPKKGISVYNAVIVCLPGNEAMKQCIKQIYINVLTKTYGERDLAVTGPHILGKYINKSKCTLENNIGVISKDNIEILMPYPTYRNEQNSTTTHYSAYWSKKNVYADIEFLTYL